MVHYHPCSAPTLRQKYIIMFQNQKLDANKSVRTLPYIGSFFAKRWKLPEYGILTLNDLVDYLYPRSITTNRLANAIDHLTQNSRPNGCITATRGSRYHRYHVPDVNRCAHATLRQFLLVLADQQNLTAQQYTRDTYLRFRVRIRAQDQRNTRNQNTRHCSCIGTRKDCIQFAGNCQWSQRKCMPASTLPNRARAFKGVGAFSGQIIPTGTLPHGFTAGMYVNNWRVPTSAIRATHHRRGPPD